MNANHFILSDQTPTPAATPTPTLPNRSLGIIVFVVLMILVGVITLLWCYCRYLLRKHALSKETEPEYEPCPQIT